MPSQPEVRSLAHESVKGPGLTYYSSTNNFFFLKSIDIIHQVSECLTNSKRKNHLIHRRIQTEMKSNYSLPLHNHNITPKDKRTTSIRKRD